MDRPLALVVAATRSNGIGISSRGLPWRLPNEMAYFARVTSDAPPGTTNAVIMGRKCWESIPPKFRPLKNRLNIVISSQKEYDLGPNAGPTILASSLEQALASIPTSLAPTSSEESSTPTPASIHRAFIIGGAIIYDQALRLMRPTAKTSSNPATGALDHRLLVTRVLDPAFDDCDVFLPEFRPSSSLKSSNEDNEEASNEEGETGWEQASHADLIQWTGFDVPQGVVSEKGVSYEFQMWVPQRSRSR